jgi:drug/metabolite transporter (DMT)-like permease
LKTPKIHVYFYALAAMLFWGMSFVWTSILLKYYEPITIIFIRLILSAAFLFLVIFISGKFERIARPDFLLIIVSAIFNPFLYFLGENFGLKNSSSTIAAVIISTIPVFSPIAAYVAYRERLRWYNLAGILLSFAGVMVMLLSSDMSFSASAKGILFLSGAVLAALFYSVSLKKLSGKYTPVTIISWQNLIGIFLFLPLFIIFDVPHAFTIVPNRSIISSFLFLSILASSLSFVFYTKTVRELGISKSNTFTNLIPVFTAIFSFFILNEAFTLRKIAGIAIVIAGVYISELGNKRP